jgi:hypothetical protein
MLFSAFELSAFSTVAIEDGWVIKRVETSE